MEEKTYKRWTEEEITYLEDSWGHKSYDTLSKHLGKSIPAIKQKAKRLDLGAMLDNGDYITFRQLLSQLNYNYQGGGITSLEKRGLPIRKIRVGKQSFKVVYLDDFWKWADKNRCFIDFSRIEQYALGKEPKWVQQQRMIDINRKHTKRLNKKKWTFVEDERLKRMALSKQYTMVDFAKEFERSEGAIRRRLTELGLYKGYVKRVRWRYWTNEEEELCKDLILKGYDYDYIASKLDNRTAMQVSARFYLMCGNSNLDSVREYLLNNKEVG